jgi:hypothetical protein
LTRAAPNSWADACAHSHCAAHNATTAKILFRVRVRCTRSVRDATARRVRASNNHSPVRRCTGTHQPPKKPSRERAEKALKHLAAPISH